MAYRKSSGRKFHPRQVLPAWSPAHTEMANLVFLSLLTRFGITDVPSYFRVLRILIVISVVVCAFIGAFGYGLKGFFLGGLLGMVAPAALLWLGVMLIGAAIFMAIYVAVWAVIICFLWWFIRA